MLGKRGLDQIVIIVSIILLVIAAVVIILAFTDTWNNFRSTLSVWFKSANYDTIKSQCERDAALGENFKNGLCCNVYQIVQKQGQTPVKHTCYSGKTYLDLNAEIDCDVQRICSSTLCSGGYPAKACKKGETKSKDADFYYDSAKDSWEVIPYGRYCCIPPTVTLDCPGTVCGIGKCSDRNSVLSENFRNVKANEECCATSCNA